MQFRYRPKDNRTPVNDPVFGHLHWDGIYDDAAMATDPRFEPIKPKRPPKPKQSQPATANRDTKTSADTATQASVKSGKETQR